MGARETAAAATQIQECVEELSLIASDRVRLSACIQARGVAIRHGTASTPEV
ncbi:MAG: hypothetical protein AAGE52_38930 [Myxococcota bacterium]